jgi:hypothetical protein
MALVVGSAFWTVRAVVDGDPIGARSAARCPAESGAAGRCSGPVGNGCQRHWTARR